MRQFTITVLIAVSTIFTSCNIIEQEPTATESKKIASIENIENNPINAKIVYVNIDTVAMNYEMFKDLNVKFVAKAEKAQTELEKKATAFQTKVFDFEKEIKNGLITRTGASVKQQSLQKEEQEIMQYQNEILNSLKEEETVLFNNVRFNIEQYIQKYNQAKKYDLIISTSKASGTVMAANPALDITTDITNGLNSEYKTKK